MELWKKQKKILAAFGGFFALMFLGTLVSRAVYASGLTQVETETPRRMSLAHQVEASGIVREGQEYAVHTLAGLRVRTVYVQVGERVEEGTLLFDLDTEELEETVREQRLAVKKLELQIQALEQNQSREETLRRQESARADQDYTAAREQADQSVERAQDDLNAAENALEEHENNRPQVTPEEDRQALQAAYEEWAAKESQAKQAMEEAKAAWDAAEEEVKRLEGQQAEAELEAARRKAAETQAVFETAQAAWKTLSDNPVEKPDFSAEDSALEAWREQRDSLKTSEESAERAVEDAEQSRENTLLEAGRKVEDAAAVPAADSSLEVTRLELESAQTSLERYEKILETEGQISAEAEGVVTDIRVSPGDPAPDGAAVVYADLTSPLQFGASLTEEQKQYVNQGDTVELKLGNAARIDADIDYVAQSESSPQMYDIRIFLPEDVGSIGESGTMYAEVQSETYACCIPLEALREDENQRDYIYVLGKRSGILGEELAAEKVYVRVLDQNDSYAAIEEGALDADAEVIVSETAELNEWDIVRYKE